jgi:chromate transporter
MALTLLEIALYFGLLSMIAFGGMPAVMPEMQRLVVEVKGWTTPTEFIQLFALAQAAPGPNVLIVSLIGWKVAGPAGALVALFSVCLPAAVLAWWVSGLWDRFKDSPWRIAIQRAITPLVVGLILASGYVLATPTGTPDWRMWLIAAASACATLATRVNPLWILAAAGVAGAILLS